MKDDPDLAPHRVWLGDHVAAPDTRPARGGLEQGREDAEQRRFATAVWAEQTEDLSAPDLERESVECAVVAVRVAEILDLEDGVASGA